MESFERLPGLQTVAEREALLLAPCAMHSAMSSGREHREAEHPYRGPFQRDRDRILHSAAFRRLSGKTQVFTDMGDYHRTRLTHTQEVASISRTIGRALRLNEDLVEALALFHDIGHPPYGHAGEDALNECLAGEGGFSHNQHALTIARELEIRHQRFPGLNLSREVLDGQAARAKEPPEDCPPLLEAQVVDTADSITYDAHDTDDALKLGMLTLDQLAAIPLIRQLRSPTLRGRSSDDQMPRIELVRDLIDYQVSDVLRYCGQRLEESQFHGPESARRGFQLGPSPELSRQKKELETFLYKHVYRHPELLAVRTQAQSRLKRMFDGFLRHPEWLPERVRQRVEKVGLPRCVGEYLAGMTDRYCDQIYQARVGR